MAAVPLDPQELQRLALDARGEFAKVLAYIEGVAPVEIADPVFAGAASRATERQRYISSYAPKPVLRK